MENASIVGAKNVLVNLAGGDSLTIQEYQDVVEIITEHCSEDVLVIAGQSYNPNLGERIKVTVIATGFDERKEVKAETDREVDVFSKRKESQNWLKKEEKKEEEKREEEVKEKKQDSSNPATITVNRWQDLQAQLGKRNRDNNDYSIPAVLRYSRPDDDEKK